MNAIILAGGKGERMLPFTKKNNKCVFKINNIPLIEYHIINLKKSGFKNIIVRTSYMPQKIHSICNKHNVQIYHENKLVKSGTAIKNIFEKFNLKKSVIINGDTYYDTFYYQYLSTMYFSNAVIVEESKNYYTGYIKFDNDFNALGIYERPIVNFDENCRYGKNIGMYILEKDILGDGDLMGDMLKNNIKLLNVIVCPVANLYDWADIGTIDKYIYINFLKYDNCHVNYLIQNNREKTIEFVKKIINSDRVFIAGNGGSLNTAEHIALDFSKCGKKQAISLTLPGFISAYGNDNGYENIFTGQLSNFNIKNKDIIIVLSGSGNSSNIINIYKKYKKNVIAMTGQKGFLYENMEYVLPVNNDDIRVIEDAHLAYGHIITQVMEGLL